MRSFAALHFSALLLLSIPSFSQSYVPFYSRGRDLQSELYGQQYENPIVKKKFASLGFGIGLPYGGIGFRAGYNVAHRLNTFAGLGYNLVGLGFNGGLQFDFATVKRSSFYLSAMAGYNAVTFVSGASEYNKTFYGPAFGLGVKVDSKKQSGNFLHIGILVPVRSAAFDDMMDRIEADPRIESAGPWPVLFTIGYNMGIVN